jgi:hypothetical protein
MSRIEAMDAALFGPTRQQRYAEKDAQAERELSELEERDRIAASSSGRLTDAEYTALFGPEKGNHG